MPRFDSFFRLAGVALLALCLCAAILLTLQKTASLSDLQRIP
jgi:hypothetical protein